MNLTQKAQDELKIFLKDKSEIYSIDATCGNGQDTLFLASNTNNNGKVFAFDIQEKAVQNTGKLLEENSLGNSVQIFNVSHTQMSNCIPEYAHKRVNIAMFNLGWLPLSDKALITKAKSTIEALKSLEFLMKPSDNLVSVLSYRGHEGGAEEFEAVSEFLSQYSPRIFGDISNLKSPILFLFSI